MKTLRLFTTVRGADEETIINYLKANGCTPAMIKSLTQKGGITIETEYDKSKAVTIVELEEEQ